MLERFIPLLVFAGFLTAAFTACGRVPPSQAPAPEEPALKAQAPGPGAFDVVKMGRYGGRMGPIYFAHELHADLPGLDGKTIACAACHLEACGAPRRCGECHKPTKRGSGAKLPST